MTDELEMLQSDVDDDEEQLSLDERMFDHPDTVSQGEYWAIVTAQASRRGMGLSTNSCLIQIFEMTLQ
jgi:hypothetical protein